MKYRNIRSMAHNFAHSFLSYMNYVDNGYVVDDICDYARKNHPGGELIIQLWPEDQNIDALFNERIQKSLGYYRAHFPKHAQSHEVNIDAVKHVQIHILKDKSHQLLACVHTLDDRGKGHEQYVRF